MSLDVDKSVILVGMFFATMTFGMIPVKVIIWTRKDKDMAISDGRQSSEARSAREKREKRYRFFKKMISLANCFSGGVFVAACLLDLFPDVRESIDDVLNEIEEKYHTTVDYPVAEFIIVFGFFLVLIVEQLVLECQEKKTARVTAVAINGEPSVEDGTAETDSLLGRPTGSYGTNNHDSQPCRQRYFSGQSDEIHVDHHSHDDYQIQDQQHDHHAAIFEEHSALRSLMLLVALTFHSIFEGLAIGLQKEVGELISIFIAVIVHKAVMAFALGLNLAQSHGMTVKYFITANLIFSIASPIGMGIGIGISEMGKSLTGDVANGVLQGVAGGTFLYITFFEVLPHEFAHKGMRLPKVLLVLVGYSIMCALLFLTN